MEELDNYYREPNVSFPEDVAIDVLDNYDILDWWRQNGSRFPVLSRMAQDYLAIPATAVPSESIFSCSGRVLDDYRSSMTPNTLRTVMCLENWLLADYEKGLFNNTKK